MTAWQSPVKKAKSLGFRMKALHDRSATVETFGECLARTILSQRPLKGGKDIKDQEGQLRGEKTSQGGIMYKDVSCSLREKR